MKKDVIYIDIEDDITSIIERVKGASAKIVALVPPKRIGVLQSAVNLKLLQKAAAGVGKRVVLITSDQSLAALAAGVKIPVAKNLQSRPEIAPIAALSIDDSDIINGEELPIGDLAKTTTPAEKAATTTLGLNDAAKVPSKDLATKAAEASPLAAKAKPTGKGAKNGLSVPNFDTFRKKLFIGGGVGVALVVFLVWAFVFAPRATVTITAKTNAVNISEPITLDPNATTAIEEGRIKPIIKQIKKTTSAEFDTTGTKEIGNKATGSMTLSNSGESDPIVVEAGTVFKSPSGQEFTSNSSVTVPGFRRSGGRDIPGTATVNVTASAIGGEYNLPSQSYATRAPVAAQGSQMSGGNRETVNVVAQADVDKAQQGLSAQNEEDVKRELRAQFGKDDIVIQESFKADVGSPTVSPAVGEQAKRARLSVETTYTVIGAPRNDVKGLLAGVLKDEIGDRNDRRIYSDGDKSISFSQFQAAQNGTFTAQLSTTGYIGPTIDDKRLAERIAGKRYGEIEQTITPIEGIEDVDIQFSPFWVNKAPKKTDKIAIKFSVKNDTN